MYSKRKFPVLTVVLMLLATVAFANGGSEESSGQSTAEGPQYGGTVTHFVGWGTEAPSADTCDAMWPAPMFGSPVLEFLIQGDFEKYGPRGTNEFAFTLERDIPVQFCKGVIAESWDVTEDKITFRIRPGVIWASYGKEHVMEPREVTAEDVAFSLNRYFDSVGGGNGSKRTENGGFVKSIYAEGNTAVVETSRFNANWLFEVGKGVWNQIYAPEVVDAGASDWNNLVGTGPFLFDEYVTGSHFAYTRNPHYHDTTTIDGVEYEVPFVDELVWPIIPDESTQLASLRTGKLDIWYCTPPDYQETLAKSAPDLVQKRWNHCTLIGIAMQCDEGPTSNKDVRRALMMAVDREPVMLAAYGAGDIWGWPVHPSISGVYTPMEELPESSQELFEYNPEKAKQILADAGYPDGLKLEIATHTRERCYVDMATMVASFWTDVGAETTVKPMETSAFTAYQRSGSANCTIFNATNANPLVTFRTNFVPGAIDNYAARYDNPYFTEQLKKAEQTVDADERNAILKELAVIAVDDVPYLPIATPAWDVSWWPWVKNYYGEWEAGSYGFGIPMGYVWIDEGLKKEMGY